ncbi:MAG: hypothetical protein HKL86_06870 [Acidimicrobiaceae bacterium]|nr:hypothetical protein [Acidimicrobiaceae bacterium]
MSDSPSPVHLNNHHRDTLVSIFQHPVSHNIEFKDVISLLSVVGEVVESSEGKFRVLAGGEEQSLTRPRGKDVDAQMVVDLRRILTKAGYEGAATRATNEGKEV